MATIEDQIELEEKMVARGAEQYKRLQREAEKSGRASDLDYSRRIMQDFLQPLVEQLAVWLDNRGPSRHGVARQALMAADPWNAVYIAMKEILNHFITDEPLVQLAGRIGRMVEDEIRFNRFKDIHSAYYNKVMQEFKRKHVQDYRYKHRVMTQSANLHNDQWVSWTIDKRTVVGMRLIDLIHENTDLIEITEVRARKGYQKVLRASAECEAWIRSNEEIRALLNPEKLPCVVQPDDWVNMQQGGYYTPEMRKSTPLIKTKSKRHRALLQNADLSRFIEAVNIVQSTPWQVNTKVLDVAREVWARGLAIGMPSTKKLEPSPCPVRDIPKEEMNEQQQAIFSAWKREASEVYTLEKERIGKSFQVARILRMANEYRDRQRFWYVWYGDFRGRIYTATAGFSIQGPDVAKGCLRFADGKPLGQQGHLWWLIHGANTYGYDKGSFKERIEYITGHHDTIMQCAQDPLSHRDFWGSADKPYQFLAWVFEYASAEHGKLVGKRVEDFVSFLPIGQDGSCNGLQNFSAMLRDSVGGKATNLVPSDRPSDIYSQVADVCTRRVLALAGSGDDTALQVKAFLDKYCEGKIPRSMAKRPVMTLPYGATRQSCTQYLYQSMMEHDRKFFENPFSVAVWLTPYMWDSIGEIVKSARIAMDWLQKCCTAMARIDKPCIWSAPDGFVTIQYSQKIETFQIDTQLNGRFQVRVGEMTGKMDKSKNRNSIAPNFVHLMDAAHLRSSGRIAKKLGVTHFAFVHDEYGTHAADIPLLHRAIREAFVGMYSQYDPLQAFYDQQTFLGGKLPPVPEKGTLDINLVKSSPYFFS